MYVRVEGRVFQANQWVEDDIALCICLWDPPPIGRY